MNLFDRLLEIVTAIDDVALTTDEIHTYSELREISQKLMRLINDYEGPCKITYQA